MVSGRCSKRVRKKYQSIFERMVSSISKEKIYREWWNVRVILLQWATRCRIQNDMKSYFMLYLAACIGDRVESTIEHTYRDSVISGNPWNLSLREGDERLCMISDQRVMKPINSNWKQFIKTPGSPSITGEIGRLHQGLLTGLYASPCTVTVDG
jgi:hypothetical protein